MIFALKSLLTKPSGVENHIHGKLFLIHSYQFSLNCNKFIKIICLTFQMNSEGINFPNQIKFNEPKIV